MKYYDLKDNKYFGLFGSDTLDEEGYNRFSQLERKKIASINKDVSYLATNSAGILAKFITNSKKVVVKAKLNDKPNMAHMPATGQCGMDLYVYDENIHDYALLDVTMLDINKDEYEIDLGHFTTNKNRRYILHLPLYIGVKEIYIALDDEAIVYSDKFNNNERIVVYGTSITQGGCVSRPGMLHTNILSRWLDYEFLNYGFSGSAFAEKEIAEIIGKRKNTKLLIIDVEANAGIDERMEENLPIFLQEYKKYQPKVPIILTSRILFALDLYNQERVKLREFYHNFLVSLTKKYNELGEKMYFLDGSKFFADNFTEYTVDGIHPTDLGSWAIAKAYNNFLRKVLP